MTIVQAIILGIVQGLTEFLPISSSGHLLLVPWLFNWHFLLENPDLNKTFDVALHLGTFVAVVLYFWREIGRLIGAWVRSISRRSLAEPEARLAWLLIVSTIPAAIVGVLLEDFITNTLGKPWMIGVAMIVFAGFMYLVDHLAKLDRGLEALTLARRDPHRRRAGAGPPPRRLALRHHDDDRPPAASRPRVGRALLLPHEHPGDRRRGRLQRPRGRQGRAALRAPPCPSPSA